MMIIINLEDDQLYLNMNNVTDIFVGRTTPAVYINYVGGKPRHFTGDSAVLVTNALDEWIGDNDVQD